MTTEAEKKELDARVKAFVLELEALTRKYGMIIHGCGCCGSPYLWIDGHEFSDESAGYGFLTIDQYDNLRWIAKQAFFADGTVCNNTEEFEKYKKDIIRKYKPFRQAE